MNFEDRSPIVQAAMVARFEEELVGRPFQSAVMTDEGWAAFPDLMRAAINDGDEVTLARALTIPAYWKAQDKRGAHVNMKASAERLGLTEFNTWYVAGLADVLVSEGETHCRVYRAECPDGEEGACSQHEEQVYSLTDVIAGHRLGYWPRTGKPVRGGFSVPAQANCHHTIGRRKP